MTDKFSSSQKYNFSLLTDSLVVTNNVQTNREDYEREEGEEELKNKIQEVKLMAIALKKKLYEDKKGDFDKLIIQYAQLQKKYFEERNELQKISSNFESSISPPAPNFVLKENKSNAETQTYEENHDRQDEDQLTIAKLSSQNTLLENQNKRLMERLTQINAQVEMIELEKAHLKEKNEFQFSLLKICSFAQTHIYQALTSNQTQIRQTEAEGLITIQANRIVIFEVEIQSQQRLLAEKQSQLMGYKEVCSFQLNEIQSIEYQRVTIKLNFEKSLTLKIQFSTKESLKQFDAILYLQRLKILVSDRKPFFNHPEIPKIPGVQGRVINASQQNRTLSPNHVVQDLNATAPSSFAFLKDRTQLLIDGSSNTLHSARKNKNLSSLYATTILPSFIKQQSDTEEELKFLSSSQNLNRSVRIKDNQTYSPQIFKDRSNQFQQQVGRLGFKKRKSLLEEKGKDLSSFLKTNGSNNRQKSADQFEENFSHPNELNFQAVMEVPMASSFSKIPIQNPNPNSISTFHNTQLQQSVANINESMLSDSIVNKSLHSGNKLSKNININQNNRDPSPQQQFIPQLLEPQLLKIKIKTDEEIHQTALDFLKKGVSMIKYSKGGYKPHEKLIALDNKGQNLNWFQVDKLDNKPKFIALKDVIQITLGRGSPGFEKFKKNEKPFSEEKSFFIICSNGRRLELEAVDKSVRNIFIRHLQFHLSFQFKNSYTQIPLHFEENMNRQEIIKKKKEEDQN